LISVAFIKIVTPQTYINAVQSSVLKQPKIALRLLGKTASYITSRRLTTSARRLSTNQLFRRETSVSPTPKQLTPRRLFSTTSINMVVKSITSLKDFNDTIAEDKLTIVDFYADWCGPCKAISPVFKDLSENTDPAVVTFAKVDVDAHNDIAQECGVQAMPTFMSFRSGTKVDTVVGANPPALKLLVQGKPKA